LDLQFDALSTLSLPYKHSHITMADGKKQPVSFDDIIKAGEPTTCAGIARKVPVTNLTSRPPEAQE
jgi:hypothetical protein